ncbi:hypothetical protein OH492_10675 [Vibrio chagasii]|nr:hypothetical protein [Vibrio chagasii]
MCRAKKIRKARLGGYKIKLGITVSAHELPTLCKRYILYLLEPLSNITFAANGEFVIELTETVLHHRHKRQKPH